jgi:sugar phosphate permease
LALIVAVLATSSIPRLLQRISYEYTLATGFMLLMHGVLLLAMSNGLVLKILAALFTGLGFGLGIPLLQYLLLEQLPSKKNTAALSYATWSIFGGHCIAVLIMNLYTDLKVAFITIAGMALIMTIKLYREGESRPERTR